MKLFEHVYLLHQRGRMDEEIFLAYRSRLARQIKLPWSVEYWPRFQAEFVPGFVEYVQNVSSDQP